MKQFLLILCLLPALAIGQSRVTLSPQVNINPYEGWIADTNTAQNARIAAIRAGLTTANTSLGQLTTALGQKADLSYTQSILGQVNSLSTTVGLLPSKDFNDARYKFKTDNQAFQVAPVVTGPAGSSATGNAVTEGNLTTFYFTIPAGPQGPPGGAQTGAVTAVNNKTAVGGNVSITSDEVPVGATNLYAVANEYGRSIKRTQANLTGTADASAYVQSLVNQPGHAVLTGTLLINSQIVPGADDLLIDGDATLVAGPGVDQIFNLQGRKNIKISGLKFVKADGNTGQPMAVLARQSSNIVFEKNTCTGVLGLQTWRPAYAGVTSASLCYNITVTNNTITGVNGGPWGGAITMQYVDGGLVSSNRIDDCMHGIVWWGGDGNYLNGENNQAGTAPKWASNLTITGNIVTRANRFQPNGGSIWGSMGRNITVTGNIATLAGDVHYDDEAGDGNTFSNNIGIDAFNSAMAVFFGSRNTQFLGNQITQNAGYGYGFNAYGNTPATNVKILGGSITSFSTTKEAIHTEDKMLNGVTIGGGLSINSLYRPITLQRVAGATISLPLSITTAAQAADGRNYAIYLQGGDKINVKGVTMVYSGTGAAGAVLASDAGVNNGEPASAGYSTNTSVEDINATGFSLGIKNDQFIGGTGNRFLNNRVDLINNNAGNLQRFGNRNGSGVLIDGSFDGDKAVQGTTGQSRTGYITTPDLDKPSGFYNYNSQLAGMASGLNNYLGLEIRHENGTGTGGWWAKQLFSDINTDFWYERTKFGDGRGWGTAQALHSNRWFPVNTAMTPTTGQVLTWNGSQWGAASTGTTANDIEVTDATKGVILKSPNGTRYRITVNNAGQLTTATP